MKTTATPMPKPVLLGDIPGYTADQLHAHAASVSAAKDAEISLLRSQLCAAANYIDQLGGVSKSYRIILEAIKEPS